MKLSQLKSLVEGLEQRGAKDETEITFWLDQEAERCHRSAHRPAFIDMDISDLQHLGQHITPDKKFSIPLSVSEVIHPTHGNW